MSIGIVVSLRIKPNHLAKALEGLQAYNEQDHYVKLSEIVRATFMHGINKLVTGQSLLPSRQSLQIIEQMTLQSPNKRNKIDFDSILEQNISSATSSSHFPKPDTTLYTDTDTTALSAVDKVYADNILDALRSGILLADNLNSDNETIARITATIFMPCKDNYPDQATLIEETYNRLVKENKS